MGLSRDLLGDLIASLERALPADEEPGRYQLLPTLEDAQAVLMPILFATGEEQKKEAPVNSPILILTFRLRCQSIRKTTEFWRERPVVSGKATSPPGCPQIQRRASSPLPIPV